jgi:hypothetical protein
MKATIERIIVFLLTGWTHRKDTHRGLATIVWNILNNGEARATVCAVGEWILVASIGRIEEFMQAIATGSGVRRDQCSTFWASFAVKNDKGGLMAHRKRLASKRSYLHERWCLFMERTLKLFKSLQGALNFNDHASTVIEYKASQFPTKSLTIDKRTKTDPLHDPLNHETKSLKCSLV